MRLYTAWASTLCSYQCPSIVFFLVELPVSSSFPSICLQFSPSVYTSLSVYRRAVVRVVVLFDLFPSALNRRCYRRAIKTNNIFVPKQKFTKISEHRDSSWISIWLWHIFKYAHATTVYGFFFIKCFTGYPRYRRAGKQATLSICLLLSVCARITCVCTNEKETDPLTFATVKMCSHNGTT